MAEIAQGLVLMLAGMGIVMKVERILVVTR